MTTELFDRISQRLKALADPTRLAILHSLQGGPLCVKEITAAIEARQANVSKHLGILRSSGLVRSNRLGAEVHYEVADPTALEICRLVCASLERDACRAVEELGQGFRTTAAS